MEEIAEPVTTDSGTDAPSFDLDAAVDKIGTELFGQRQEQAAAEPAPAMPEPSSAPELPSTPTLREVPKSWPKEMHDYWPKTDPKVQEYWQTREKQMLDGLEQYKQDAQFAKSFREALNPYRQTLQALNVDELTAAKQLFQADHLLRYSQPDQRRQYFMDLAKSYGVDLNGQPGQPTAPVDPVVQKIQQELQSVKQNLDMRNQADLQAAREQVTKEVEAFAADKEQHPYFDEVADDIIKLIGGGYSLQDAYRLAVRGNDVIYAKEMAKATEAEKAKAKENARLDALKAKTASSSNVKSRDTKRTPTESVGTMEDTIRETLRETRSRITP